MKLDVYRSCSWKEKRDVLNVFWRTNVDASSRIVEASVQYDWYAIICLVVVMVEVAFILGVALDRNALIVALTVLAELFTIWSTWWAIKRFRVLKLQFVLISTEC